MQHTTAATTIITNNYPEKIEYYGQIWFRENYISMQKGTVENPTAFKNERKIMRNRQLLSQFGCFHEHRSYLDNKYFQETYEVIIEEKQFISKLVKNALNGEYIFVLTCEEKPRLLCCKDGTYLHSYLANGKKVLAVGTLTFQNGLLKEISNNSGHYRPTDMAMLLVIEALYIASGRSLEIYTSYSKEIIQHYSIEKLANNINFSDAILLQGEEKNVIKKRFNKPLNQESAAKFNQYLLFLDILKTKEGMLKMSRRQEEMRKKIEEEKNRKLDNPDDGYDM